jgi:hypothetical protein
MKIDLTPMVRRAQTMQWLQVPKSREVLGLLNAVDLRVAQKNGSLQFDPTSPIVSELCEKSAIGAIGTIARITSLTHADGAYRCRVVCPHCKKEHAHGLGTGTLPEFGHRVADCGLGSYHLAAGVKA